MRSKSLIVLAVLFLCAWPAFAGIDFISDGKIHNIDYTIYDSIYVDYKRPQMYTTINWLDGGDTSCRYNPYTDTCEIALIRLFNDSRINVFGGHITSLEPHGNTHTNITGGLVSWMACYASSQIDLFDGQVRYRIRCLDSSKVNIEGGLVGTVYSLQSSQVSISNGSINNWIYSCNSSQVYIVGGSIGGELRLWDQSLIQIFGYDFAVDGQPVGYGELTSLLGGEPKNEPLRRLTGTLLSGELIDNDFRIGNDAKIILIPEPATVLLLGIGGLLLKRRRS